MAEVGQRNHRPPANAEQVSENLSWRKRRLDRLAQDCDVEGAARIVAEIGIGVALHDGQTARNAGIHVLLRKFKPATVDIFVGGQMLEQCAVATTDIEHARAVRNHLRDGCQISSQCLAHALALAATAFRKPRIVANISGSSSRNASCPRSVRISTKLTVAAVALSACAMSLFSAVGNSQSLVNEMMQKRVLLPAKASASRPPCSAARSK